MGSAANLRPSSWITNNTSISVRGKIHPFKFDKYPFQLAIVDNMSRQLCFKKCCQIGATEIFVRLALETVANRGYNTILTQPNFEASRNFSKSRIQPVIDESQKLSHLIKETNSVNLKKIGGSFLYVKYTKGAEQHALSDPADVRISDEVDQSDQANLKLFQSRLENSAIRMTRDFGTPTIPKFGISLIFDNSVQNFYKIKCPHCGHWNTMDIRNLIGFPIDIFEENIPDFPLVYKETLERLENVVYIGCKHCQKSLEYADNLIIPETSVQTSPLEPKYEWVCKETETVNPDKVQGYHINQFATGLKTGKMILQSMQSYERLRDIYNQLLGEGFIASKDRLTEEDLHFVNFDFKPPYAVMGVDFGKATYVVIYSYDPVEKKGFVTKVYEVPLFTLSNDDNVITEILRIARENNVHVAVVDALPYQNSVAKLKNLANFAVLDCYLTDREHEVFKLNPKKMTVRGNRTAAIDSLVSDMKSERDVFTKGCMDDRRLLVSHLTNFMKVEAYGKYYYPKIGDDHLGFATMYAKKAAFILNEQYSLVSDYIQVAEEAMPLEVGMVKMKN